MRCALCFYVQVSDAARSTHCLVQGNNASSVNSVRKRMMLKYLVVQAQLLHSLVYYVRVCTRVCVARVQN